MERTVPFLNGCISFVAFVTALSLVVYMLIAFVTGVFDVALLIFDTVFLGPADRQEIFQGINADFLHTVAVLLILMKSYRILVEYMKYHHIDIKFMVEIAIIASVMELLFNYSYYTEDMRIILLGLGVGFLALYVFKYDTLVRAMENSKEEMHRLKDAQAAAHAERLAAKAAQREVAKKSRVVAKTAAKKAPAKRTRRTVAKKK